ncbi:MAG: 50S ribosomal protein L32 [Patescibacteria group bacterium]
MGNWCIVALMVVRMRHTRGHTANRRSHHALTATRLSACVKCNAPHVRHRMCENCGTYREREMVDVVAKAGKKAAKAKARGAEKK